VSSQIGLFNRSQTNLRCAPLFTPLALKSNGTINSDALHFTPTGDAGSKKPERITSGLAVAEMMN
jgi:hypothetical protein